VSGAARPGPTPGDVADTAHVRPATDDDAPGLIVLVGTCFAEFEGCVLDTEHEMAHLRAVASHFSAVSGRVWVAEAAGGVVGSVACRPMAEGGGDVALHLQLLYVAAGARRRGLGSRLVSLVEREALGRGIPTVELWSDTRFTDAHRLYRSLGYDQLPGARELHDLSDTVEYHFAKRLGR